MRPADLLCLTESGLCCPPGGFHIDPLRPVERALVTHAHADHARRGNDKVMATRETLDMMRLRYGEDFAGTTQEARLGEAVEIGGVRVSFHPAGHVLGSAQIKLEWNGLRIVVSGDYKCRPDPTCRPFEPIPCDIFVSEATFALPVFRHPDDRGEVDKLIASTRQSPERAHIVGVYALGKAQRLIRLLREAGYDAPIYIHGALQALCDYYQSQGIDMGRLEPATVERGDKGAFAGAIVLGPPSAFVDRWARRFPEPLAAFASGWMRIRQRARQRGVELPLVVSDHCDWPELTATIAELRPEEVWVTHGREEALVRWCELQGLAARPLHLVGYEEELE